MNQSAGGGDYWPNWQYNPSFTVPLQPVQWTLPVGWTGSNANYNITTNQY